MNLKRSLENLFKGSQAVLPMTRSKDDPNMAVPVTADDPLPVVVIGGGVGSGSADTASNREATQQQLLAAVQALAPLLGNTDGLETLAATNRDLLTQMQGLLQTLGGNTDDLERLLSALGVTDENVLTKLEAIRVLTESTNTHMQAANGNSFVLANQALNEGVHVRPAPPLAPVSRQTLALSDRAQGLTVPASATAARISVRGGNASVAVTAPAPTASEGDLWPDGSMWELGQGELSGFRAVVASGAPVLQVTYLGVSS